MGRIPVPLLLAAVASAIVVPTLVAGRTPVPTDLLAASSPWADVDPEHPPAFANRHHYDIVNYVYPHEVTASRALAGGELPWWDPTTLCGHPLLADGQTATLYPPKLLLQSCLSPSLAYAFYLLLHLAGCGVGMYAYLRHAGCGRAAAGAGGLVWMLCGQSVVHYKYGSVHALGAFLPLALLCLERLEGERPRGAAAGLALALAAILLSSHPQLLYYAALILGAAAAARWGALAAARETRGRALRAAGWAAGAALAGVLIAAPQFLPLADLALHGQREPKGVEDLFPAGMRYIRLLGTFVFPRLYGGPLDRIEQYDAGANMCEFQGYIGVLSLLLFVPLGLRAARRRERWLWGGLGAASVLCATGTPAYDLLGAMVPGLKQVSPFKILYVWTFAATILAARGADALMAGGEAAPEAARLLRRWRWVLAAGWGIALAAALAGELAAGRAAPGSWPRWIHIGNPVIHWPLVWWGGAVALAFVAGRPGPSASLLPSGLLILLGADLAQLFIAYNPTYDAAPLESLPPEYRCLRERRDPHYRHVGFARVASYDYPLNGIAPLLDLTTAEGYDSLYPGCYMRLTQGVVPTPPQHTHVVLDRYASPILDMLSVRHALLPRDAAGVPTHWREVFRDRMVVYENPRALPRAYVVYRTRTYVPDGDAGKILTDPAFRPAEECVVMDDEDYPLWGKSKEPAKARIADETFNTMRIDVEASGEGILVVTDTYDAGWRARVDGKEAPVLRVNIAQRGVPVPAGRHVVELRYAPRGIGAAWALCATGLAGVAALARRSRRRDSNALT